MRGRGKAAARGPPPTDSAPDEASQALGQLMERVATKLPTTALIEVLRPLPGVELARLACVHKAYHAALLSLRVQFAGPRYDPSKQVWYSTPGRLVRAAAHGDVAVISAMISAGVDERGKQLLQARSGGERAVDSALCYAALRGHPQAVELLLDAGADLHHDDDEALRYASQNGHTDVVALLLQRGADVHARNDCSLWWASGAGRADVVALLIEHGADVHALDEKSLRWASGRGHTHVMALLVQHGANVNAGSNEALRWASKCVYANVVQLLIQHGADVHAEDDEALHEVSGKGHADVVALLIQHGADVHAGLADAHPAKSPKVLSPVTST